MDIKPDNLVFTNDGTGYITDFGCAKKSSTPQISPDAIGDNRYFSPGRLQACKDGVTFDGEEADLWAAGVTLLQIIKNLDPCQLFEMPNQFTHRVQNCTPDFFQKKARRFAELLTAEESSVWWVIKRLLDPRPITRITAQQLLETHCFKGLDNTLQAKVFEDLKREIFAESAQVKKEEVYLNDYASIAKKTRKEETPFYNSEQNREFYDSNSYTEQMLSSPDYLFTPADK
ncbi:MAG: hypothetical protein K940chlam7_01868 [Chlamydiae bacterium]|nr:hypothetical protein [Chlamydiota bacterium]